MSASRSPWIFRILVPIGILALAIALYLLFWPVPIDPVAWEPPKNTGYTGDHAPNSLLADLEYLPLPAGTHGPEDVAVDRQGRIYTGCVGGEIVRFAPDGRAPEVWVNTGGRPLGLGFDARGNLIVADALRGLLSVDPAARVKVLTARAGDSPIRFADDLDIARDGRIYFSDASTKFGAGEFSGVGPASLLDIMEHGGHGRLLRYDPATGATEVLLEGLNFANGVALASDDSYVLVNESGSYRVLRYWLNRGGPQAAEEVIGNLPGFPDNVDRGSGPPNASGDLFWVAMASPRSAALDDLASSPGLRKLAQRLPTFLRPRAVPYVHVIAIRVGADGQGQIVHNLQDPDGAYHMNTSALESGEYLYLGSLLETSLARAPRSRFLNR